MTGCHTPECPRARANLDSDGCSSRSGCFLTPPLASVRRRGAGDLESPSVGWPPGAEVRRVGGRAASRVAGQAPDDADADIPERGSQEDLAMWRAVHPRRDDLAR